MKVLNVFLILLLPGIIYAADNTGLSRSAGKLVNDNSINLHATLTNSTVSEIFDAWVELSGDIDHDGFFHRIKTTFDADVNTPAETAYAKLYLSYEGGPWQQYADSDLYGIFYDSVDDSYEVVGELIEGYPPGYYEVLIELHSFYHPGVVASRMVSFDEEGYSITLEDLSFDEVYVQEEVYYEPDYIVSSGSFSWAGILMLSFLLIIKLKYFSAANKAANKAEQ